MKVIEITNTLVGESTFQGEPCTLIRLHGCNLKCHWCDTDWKNMQIEEYSVPQLVDKIVLQNKPIVLITGGEPLLHKEELPLLILSLLEKKNYHILIETNGTQDLSFLPIHKHGLHIIMDIKTPSSGVVAETLWSNLQWLQTDDDLKFVVDTWEDLKYVQSVMERVSPGLAVSNIFVQPVIDSKRNFLDPTQVSTEAPSSTEKPSLRQIGDWVLDFVPLPDCLQEGHRSIRMQIQLHKLIQMK